jgi:hypothetical protein
MSETLQAALVAKLGTMIKWQVANFPDNPKEWKLLHPKGAVLVQYGASRYGKPDGLGVIVQQRDVQLGLQIVGRAQHGDSGAVTMLDFLIETLPGQQLPGYTPIYLLRDSFISESSGIWNYQLEIAMQGLIVGQHMDNTL